MLQWYLFRVRARAEQTVSKQVEAMGYSTFLPQVLKRSRPHDSAIMSPLFPGYLFIRLDPYRASFAPVLKLFGMIDIIRTTGEIRPVELALVVSLRRRCQANPELVLEPMLEHIDSYLLNRQPEIIITPLGGDIVLMGALALAMKK